MNDHANYNMTISVCRILAMFMIIICHIGSATGRSAIGQLFQVGVQVFLFISGYLYSSKNIDNTKEWLRKRFIRICIPCYFFVGVIVVVNMCLDADFSWAMVVLCFFNLEGYHHIFNTLYYLPAIPGTAHFWFITVLVICYILTIFVKRKPEVLRFLMIFLSGSIVLGGFGIRLDYFWIYFAGYIYGKSSKVISRKKYILICLAAVAAGVLRMIGKGYCDVNGENNVYLYVVIPFVYNILAIWIFVTMQKLTEIKKVLEKIAKDPLRKMILWLDGLSFYVFITHYMFIDGPLRILGLTQYSFLNGILLTAVIIAVSIALKKISLHVGNQLDSRMGGICG